MFLQEKQFIPNTSWNSHSAYLEQFQPRPCLLACLRHPRWNLKRLSHERWTDGLHHPQPAFVHLKAALQCLIPKWICYWTNNLSQLFNDPLIMTNASRKWLQRVLKINRMLLCDGVDVNIVVVAVIVIILGVNDPILSAVEYCFCLCTESQWGPKVFFGWGEEAPSAWIIWVTCKYSSKSLALCSTEYFRISAHI